MNKCWLFISFTLLFLGEAASNYDSHQDFLQEILPEGQSLVISLQEDMSRIASTYAACPSDILSAKL